jgi:hypothetical protein
MKKWRRSAESRRASGRPERSFSPSRRRTLRITHALAWLFWASLTAPAAGVEPKESPEDLVRRLLAAPPRADLPERTVVDRRTQAAFRYWEGNVRWEFESHGQKLRLRCDRMAFFAPGILGALKGLEKLGAPAEGGEGKELGRVAESILADVYIYAEGNVRLEAPRLETTLEAESLYLHYGQKVAVARKARLQTTNLGLRRTIGGFSRRAARGAGPHPRARDEESEARIPIIVTADVLRTTDLRTFEVEGVRLTDCDFAVPHAALAADWARVVPSADDGDGETGGDRSEEPQNYSVDLDGARLEVLGHEVLPIPIRYWESRWHDYFPVRAVDLGNSGKFGLYASLDWNLNFFLRQLPLEHLRFLRDLERRSSLAFETTYMSRRGFGWGPKGEYGRDPGNWQAWQLELSRWEYYGEGSYFRLRDHGEDRSAQGTEPEDPSRFWGYLLHRQSVPYLGTFDIEYSEFSDPNFLREFFESVDKEDKEQESLVAWRRNVTDNLAFTGLFKYRANDFQTEVERLPEGRLFLSQEPVFDTGLYTDLQAQAANIRLRPADDLPGSSLRLARADVLNEWSFPLRCFSPYLDVRPFALGRYTYYEEVLDPTTGSEDRGSFGAGMTLSQEWSRVFAFDPESLVESWLGIEKLKHVVVPQVTYLNVFANDLAPDEVVVVDDVERVRLDERVALTLRQAFISRTESRGEAPPARKALLGGDGPKLEALSYTTRPVLESEVSFVVFPRPGRDNGGDSLSELILDHTFSPYEPLALRSWIALDPNEGLRPERSVTSLTADVVKDAFSTTVGQVYTRVEGGAPDSNFFFTLLSLYLGEKWRFQAYWSRDLEEGRDVEYSFVAGRIFHRFALTIEYSVDVGEDRDETVSVNFQPLDLLGGHLFPARRRW